MWAQLMRTTMRPGLDAAEAADRIRAVHEQVRAAEQEGSGLVRTLVMQDQRDPREVYALVVFESEEKARVRERDPRRGEQLGAARTAMADLYEGAPDFTDLVVIGEWAD